MMSLTLGLFTQVSDPGPQGPLVYNYIQYHWDVDYISGKSFFLIPLKLLCSFIFLSGFIVYIYLFSMFTKILFTLITAWTYFLFFFLHLNSR